MVSGRDIDDLLRFLKSDAAPFFGIESIHGKSAKVAFGVADIRDGELKITRTAVSEHVAQQGEGAFLWSNNRAAKVSSRCRLFRHGGIRNQCGSAHSTRAHSSRRAA